MEMEETTTILGLESSCDDTAAAVVRQCNGDAPTILSSIVQGQNDLHAAFGGVVPESAARAHVEKLDSCVKQALVAANLSLQDIDAIAVTSGPGLIGGVLSGVMCAKGLSAGLGIPLIGINHLAGHALTPRLTDQVAYPYLMLLVSGGHCQFLIVRGPDEFSRLGGTIDDAPGEAFDKTARLLGLPQPGGPNVQAKAIDGDPKRFAFPRPLLDRPGCDFSFSGLKTALLRARNTLIAEKNGLTEQDQADLCAGFQAAVADVIAKKTARALAIYLAEEPNVPLLAVAGGVAANTEIRARLRAECEKSGTQFNAPPLALCTDNAAMIAYVGLERFKLGKTDDMTLSARPRWPLDQLAPALLGSGKKGAKA
jgi:N6-L-threonylcarbamoyladenine synthase